MGFESFFSFADVVIVPPHGRKEWAAMAQGIRTHAWFDVHARYQDKRHFHTWWSWACLHLARQERQRLTTRARSAHQPEKSTAGPAVEDVMLALLEKGVSPGREAASVDAMALTVLNAGALRVFDVLWPRVSEQGRDLLYAKLHPSTVTTPPVATSRVGFPTPWMDWVARGRLHLVQAVLDRSLVDLPRARDIYGQSALFVLQHPAMFDLLLRHGMDPGEINGAGETALDVWVATVEEPKNLVKLIARWTEVMRHHDPEQMRRACHHVLRTRVAALTRPVLTQLGEALGTTLLGETLIDEMPLMEHALGHLRAWTKKGHVRIPWGVLNRGTHPDKALLRHLVTTADMNRPVASDGHLSMGLVLALEDSSSFPIWQEHGKEQWVNGPEAALPLTEQWARLQEVVGSKEESQRLHVEHRWWNLVNHTPLLQERLTEWWATPSASTGLPPIFVPHEQPWGHLLTQHTWDKQRVAQWPTQSPAFRDDVRAHRRSFMPSHLDPTDTRAPLWMALILLEDLHPMYDIGRWTPNGLILAPPWTEDPEVLAQFNKDRAFLSACFDRNVIPHPGIEPHLRHHASRSVGKSDVEGYQAWRRRCEGWVLNWLLPQAQASATPRIRL